jgi:hypothetical protein
MRDHYADAVRWIDRALSLPSADDHPALRVHALCFKAMCLWTRAGGAEAPAAMAEAEAIARALADPAVLSQVLQIRADREALAGRLDVADALADEALRWAMTAGDDLAMAAAAFAKAMAASTIAQLRERVDWAASLMDEAGNIFRLADLLASAAYVALGLGADRDAKEFVDRAIPPTRALDNPYLWMLLRANFGLAALLTGDTDSARDAFREELEFCRELVLPRMAYEGLSGLAAVAAVRGDNDRAARLSGAAAAHRYDQRADHVTGRLDAAFIQPARTRHGADAWDASARDGATLSFEDAIAYALQEKGK